ncbi:hypothetical protein TNCV_1231831 [Trichonephila clavipes]|nr:hypothetical protein TNCV_1231831 [Trichonephila clavipes]
MSPIRLRNLVLSDKHVCTLVFVKRESVLRPLQPPYDSQFFNIKHSVKPYKLRIHGNPTLISIARLKPAFVHNADDIFNIGKRDTETKPGLWKTRSGRRVHFLDYLVSSR